MSQNQMSPTSLDRAHVVDLISGCWRTAVILQFVNLELADALTGGPRSSAELAVGRDVDPESLFRLLRAVATTGLIKDLGGQRFELTPQGALLARDAEDSLRSVALHWGARLWHSYADLGGRVRTGKPVASSPEDFARLQSDPAKSAMFNRAMAEQSLKIGQAVAERYDFARYSRVLDVGGGLGSVLSAILNAYPQLSGAVFDLPALQGTAEAYLAEQGVGDRGSFLGGSFFEAVVGGYDCQILKYIIHDWTDEESQAILSNCAKAAGENGVVLVVEQIVPQSVGPSDLAVIRADMTMLTVGGKERTEAQYQELFERSGLKITGITPAGGGFSIIESRPI